MSTCLLDIGGLEVRGFWQIGDGFSTRGGGRELGGLVRKHVCAEYTEELEETTERASNLLTSRARGGKEPGLEYSVVIACSDLGV